MTEDDLAAALVRLLEPTTAEMEDDDVRPYWAMTSEMRGAAPTDAIGAEAAPGLAAFLSESFADAAHPMPSLADIAAYVDGGLDGPARARFEAALVASPELRAEVETLTDRLAAFEDDDVAPATPGGREPPLR